MSRPRQAPHSPSCAPDVLSAMSAIVTDLMSASSPGSTDRPLPIAVLVSGKGTNLQALLDTVHGHEAEIVAVASSTAEAPALQKAIKRGVQTAVFPRSDYADRGERDEAMAEWLLRCGARLVVLAGFMEL